LSFNSADAQPHRIKVAFDKIIVNNDHDPVGAGDGEWALDVYVNEIKIPLWIGTGLTDVGDGGTVYFGPDKTIELDVPHDGQIRIVTAGFEEDTAGTSSALPDISGDLKRIPTV
jgi:hypothetical protein